KLRKENCEVLVPSTYYPNGITLRDSVRKRLGDWTQQQLDQIEIVEEEVSEYVRYGVFAFRVERRELRNRSIVVFLREIVEDLLKTPDNDLRPLTEEAFVPRAEPYAASP
uniref:Uncharacterized protein n=2 Tax=Phytophthora ramorum TaxID=164328 RepID=H3GL22_PHYRM